MKVYDVPGFPNPARVRSARAEKGALDAAVFVPVDVMGGEHRKDAFLAKNPDGAVPVLELECGTCISECTAITEYLDHAYGAPSLTGKTPKDRAQIHMMNRRAEAGLLDAVGAYFHHATPGLGPDLETNQNAAWGEAQKLRAQKTMVYLNDVLSRREYLAGDSFSMADITAFAGLGFADFAKVDIASDLTHLHAWCARIAARPSCAA